MMIELKSIGHVIDDICGKIYPQFEDGSIDFDNPMDVLEESESDEPISEEDLKVINRVILMLASTPIKDRFSR